MNDKLNNIELTNCFKNPENKINHNKKLFSFISSKYNLATQLLSFAQDQKWKKELIRLLPPIDQPNCLDIACGTGDITFKISKKYKDAQICGLDITQAMIDQAIKINNQSNISFVCQNMSNTQFDNNSFDIVTGSYALRNSPDLKSTLLEINRILKKNGTLAILDFSKFDNLYLQKIQFYILKFWGCLWGLILHRNHTTYSYISESIKYYPSNSEFNKLVKEYGFEILENKKFFLGTIQIHILKKV